jgi:DNA-binding transcriptional LysR family regulator
MSLSSIQLEAFLEVANSGSFSLAAKRLHVTQSALSQRILNLEEEIATRLFVRDPAGIRLTKAGEELLRFCISRQRMEQDVVAKIETGKQNAMGVLKIAGFSSVIRSVILPVLSGYISNNPQVQMEILSREMRDLHPLLVRGDVDFIVTSLPVIRQDVESALIGHESLVMAEAATGSIRQSVFFDHDAGDQTTVHFFNHQKSGFPEGFRREYLGEIYAIIDAVASGLGRAVLPRHLIKQRRELKVVRGFQPQISPVYLQYFKQSFPTRIHDDVIRLICKESKKIFAD